MTWRAGRKAAAWAAQMAPVTLATALVRFVRIGAKEESHMILAYLLAAVLVVHIIGALRHHIVKRNDVLRRMTWGMRA